VGRSIFDIIERLERCKCELCKKELTRVEKQASEMTLEDHEDFKVDMICSRCPPEDHEGYANAFCRCEDRNIRLARRLRKQGINVWEKDEVK
jgi:hypothetical protein